MTPVEIIEKMLAMEKTNKQKDKAGIYIARNVDSAVRQQALKDCIKELQKKDN